MDRRDLLRAIGATGTLGAATALAGCNEYVGGPPPEGERAHHDGWVGAASAGEGNIGAITLDLGKLYDLDDDAATTTASEATTAAERETDPLLGIPASYFGAIAFLIGFGLRETGVQGLIEEDGDAELVTVMGQGMVVEGSFAGTTVEAAVADAGGNKIDDYEGYAIYQEDGTQSNSVIAVTDDVVLIVTIGDDTEQSSSTDGDSNDPVATVERIVDVHEGRAERYSSTVAEYDDLVTALPNGIMTGVGFDETGGLFTTEDGESTEDEESASSDLLQFSDIDLEGDALGSAVSVGMSNQEMEVSLAIRYASADEVDETDAIEDAIGWTASSRDITVDGPMLYVEGTFRDKDLAEV